MSLSALQILFKKSVSVLLLTKFEDKQANGVRQGLTVETYSCGIDLHIALMVILLQPSGTTDSYLNQLIFGYYQPKSYMYLLKKGDFRSRYGESITARFEL